MRGTWEGRERENQPGLALGQRKEVWLGTLPHPRQWLTHILWCPYSSGDSGAHSWLRMEVVWWADLHSSGDKRRGERAGHWSLATTPVPPGCVTTQATLGQAPASSSTLFPTQHPDKTEQPPGFGVVWGSTSEKNSVSTRRVALACNSSRCAPCP
jgi:hypothetical protein